MNLSPQIMLAIAVVVIGLLIIVLNRRRINIWLIKALYGKYSFRYVKYFKDHNMKGPFSPCLKDDFITHLTRYFDKPVNSKEYKTNQSIRFGNTEFGKSYKRIKREKGTPDCFNVSKIHDNDLKIIGYRESMFNTNIKSVYYFLNNVFFMGEYMFSESARGRIPEIADLLCQKYLEKAAEKDVDNFYIHDPYKTSIHFEDNGFNLSIKYYNGTNEQLIQKLKSYYEESKKSKVGVHQEFKRELSDML